MCGNGDPTGSAVLGPGLARLFLFMTTPHLTILTYTFGGDLTGDYTWFALVIPAGANPYDSSRWLSLDLAPFIKQ